MILSLQEGRVQPVEVGFGGQPDGVAEEREVNVACGVEFELSGVFTGQPCLSSQVVVQSLPLLLDKLSADADVVFGPVVKYGVAVGIELRHGISA